MNPILSKLVNFGPQVLTFLENFNEKLQAAKILRAKV